MALKGTIEVNGLRVFARHGVFEQERTVGNMFEVTVHIRYPIEEAGRSDNVSATVNYAEVVDIINEIMATPVALLERVAYCIHCELTRRYPAIEGGMVRVAKLTPPITAQLSDVAAKLEW